MRMILRIINKAIFIIVLATIVVFCINNNQTIQISFSPLPFEIEARAFILILICLFLGILIGISFMGIALVKEKFRNFLGRLKIKSLQKKVSKNLEL